MDYLLCCCVRSLKQSAALSKLEWVLLGASSVLLALAQGFTFLLPAPWSRILDYAAYAITFTVLACCMFKLVLALYRDRNRSALLALSVSCYAWTVSTMYMSTGIFYLSAQLILIVSSPIILVTLRREEAAA